jgi:hypothetical protein
MKRIPALASRTNERDRATKFEHSWLWRVLSSTCRTRSRMARDGRAEPLAPHVLIASCRRET